MVFLFLIKKLEQIIIKIKSNKKKRVLLTIGKQQCGDYIINIQSVETGHPDSQYDFSTYYKKNYTRENYKFSFETSIGIQFKKGSVYKEYDNYRLMENINLFHQDFKYYKISNNEIVLIYQFDEDFYYTIDLKDDSQCYDLQGYYMHDEQGKKQMLENYSFINYLENDYNLQDALIITVIKK